MTEDKELVEARMKARIAISSVRPPARRKDAPFDILSFGAPPVAIAQKSQKRISTPVVKHIRIYGDPRGIEGQVKLREGRTNSQKLGILAPKILGKDVVAALSYLENSHSRIASSARRALISAISSAQNVHHLDVDSLIVADAFVGKPISTKRQKARIRKYFGQKENSASKLTIILQEPEESLGSVRQKA